MPLQWPLVGRHGELELFVATLADPRAHGFVIHGPPGVGKTRLADQCLATADGSGRNVARATATEGSRSIPLGALAHLLAGRHRRRARRSGDGDVGGSAGAAGAGGERSARAVRRRSASPGHDVGDVRRSSSSTPTSCSSSPRFGPAAPLPPGLDALWHRARVRRIDLEDLDRAAVDTLLHLVLHGPVEAATVTEIWTASRGNVLFVRELVLGAIDGDHLVRQHGVWRLVGSLVATPRLQEVVATRLAALPPTAADALDRLAVWEPTGLSPLEDVVGRDQLELLDRAGLLTVRADGRRQTVTFAHPLYGEILRARMPALVRRRLLLEHADCLDAHGARRREDPLRAASARLEVSGSAELGLLVRAARLARYGQDFTQVERLGRAALRHGMTPEVGLLVGEALHELGSFAEADEVLTAAEASVTDADPLLVHITEIRSRNLVWGLFRGDEALAVNRSARDRLGDGPGVEELTLNEASLLSYCGRPLDALALLEPMPHTADPRARALRAMAEVPALVATGRCATGAATAARAYAEQMELSRPDRPPGPGRAHRQPDPRPHRMRALERRRGAGHGRLRGDTVDGAA